MKHYLILPLLAALCQIVHARVITVDSDPANVAMYHDFQQAYDAAEDGDTLLLRGDFGQSTRDIYKRLTIMSQGDSTGGAQIGLSLRRDPSIGDASGSKLIGLWLWETRVHSGVTGVEISRCLRANGSSSYSWNFFSPVVLQQCYAGYIYLQNGSSGSILTNTFVSSLLLDASNILVENCVVFSRFDGFTNTSISNTIFRPSASNFTSNGSSFSHCLAIGENYLPEGSGNLNGLTFAEVYASGTSGQIADDSVAKTGGTDGREIGAYGGSTPYTLNVGIPRITNYSVNATATSTSGLRFQVEARAYPE